MRDAVEELFNGKIRALNLCLSPPRRNMSRNYKDWKKAALCVGVSVCPGVGTRG